MTQLTSTNKLHVNCECVKKEKLGMDEDELMELNFELEKELDLQHESDYQYDFEDGLR